MLRNAASTMYCTYRKYTQKKNLTVMVHINSTLKKKNVPEELFWFPVKKEQFFTPNSVIANLTVFYHPISVKLNTMNVNLIFVEFLNSCKMF